MALAKNPEARRQVLRLGTTRNGFDFYFLSLADAQQMASFLARSAPIRTKTTKKLVSTDAKNNTANVKYTVVCDIVALCRNDLVLIHKSAKGNLLCGRLAIVGKVSAVVHLLDASPKRSSSSWEIRSTSRRVFAKTMVVLCWLIRLAT